MDNKFDLKKEQNAHNESIVCVFLGEILILIIENRLCVLSARHCDLGYIKCT